MSVLVIAAAFVAMEPLTSAVHRWVMHGFGRALHRSHHVPSSGRLEANDWFPVMFATLVMAGLAVGFNAEGFGVLVPVGVGVTLYGLAYATVHEVYIHRRLGLFGERRFRLLDRLADAHQLHHRYHGEPYGMLVPVVPRRVRERAAGTSRSQRLVTGSSGPR